MNAVNHSTVKCEVQKYFALYQSVVKLVDHSRHKAQTGRLETARRHLRFLENSCVVEILTAVDSEHHFTSPFNADIPLLRWKMGQLRIEAYPVI